MNTLYHLIFDLPDDAMYGLLKAFAVTIVIIILVFLIFYVSCLLLQKLFLKIGKWILISDIKENPKNADKLIENSDCNLDDEFYQKYASKSLQLKRKFQHELYGTFWTDTDNWDVIAQDKFRNLKNQYDDLQLKLLEREEEAKRKVQQNKMEVLTNKASQALDEVWD